MIAPTKAKPQSTSTNVPCVHCGLPAQSPKVGLAFCCDGCRGAYALIHEWDLEDYYALRDQLGGRASRPQSANDDAQLLDNAEVLGNALKPIDDDHCSIELAVEGVHCGACAWLIERAVPLVDGWDSARVNLAKRSVEIIYSHRSTKLSTIARTLQTFGYQLRPLSNTEEPVDVERLARLRRIAVAGFCFANAMWIAVALYAGADGAHGRYLTVFGTLLAFVSVFGPGRVFLRSAWASLRTRTPHIDLPVSVGLLAGLAGSLVHLFTGSGESYLDSLCGLVFFLLLGRELQARGQQRATAAVRALASLRPPLANRVVGENETSIVRASDLQPGDVVRVQAGETVPVDGVVTVGRSLLDQSILTGESVAVETGPGDTVAAGVINIERPIDIRAQATADETRVAAISRLVEESLSNRTPLVRKADHIGGVFVVAVLLAAVLTFGWALASQSALDAGQRAVALLVVACPCALALATPLAIGVAVGRAAKVGVLVRRGDVFEHLHRTGTVWFDKTGTLTEGRPTLVDWLGDDATLMLAASVEQDSKHPIARCLRDAASTRGLTLQSPRDMTHRRQGVIGCIADKQVIVGTRSLLETQRISISPAHRIQSELFAADGVAPNFVAIDGEVAAIFAIGDQLRREAKSTIDTFRQAGWNVGILSGDHADVVAHIGSKLGLPRRQSRGELSPEDKLEIVRSEDRQAGPVVFVGDGVNDAAALAAADVGIATSGAAEASLQAASVYCPGSLDEVDRLLAASTATVRAIHRLLAVSLSYNILAGFAAIGGYINPLVAAVLMPISSLTVTALAFASTTFPSEPTKPSGGTPRSLQQQVEKL